MACQKECWRGWFDGSLEAAVSGWAVASLATYLESTFNFHSVFIQCLSALQTVISEWSLQRLSSTWWSLGH